jgi:outer membrane protein assembly factor BamB
MGRHALRAVTVLAAATLLSGCWFQIGFDGGHTRSNPWEQTLTPDTVGGLRVVWQRSGADSEATVARGKVFVSDAGGSAGHVLAFDLATGTLAWSTELVRMNGFNPAVSVTPVTVQGDRLVSGFLGIDTRTLDCSAGVVALDPDTGALTPEPLFAFPSYTATADGVSARSLESTGDPVCTGSSDPFFLDVSVDRPGMAPTHWMAAPSRDSIAPAVAGDQVLVARGSTVAAYNATGCGADVCSPIWSKDLSGPSDVMAAASGPVYVTSDDHLVALERTTGNELWRGPLGGTSRGFALAGGTVYATVEPSGSPAQLVTFPAGGCGAATCPATSTSALAGTGARQPVVAGGVVYASTDGAVQGFDASGCGAASCPALVTVPVSGGGVLSVSDGHVLLSGHGTLTALALR